MSDKTTAAIAGAFVAGAVLGILTCRVGARVTRASACSPASLVSMPDQPARFAAQKASRCVRALDIDQVYDPNLLKGKRVMVTGGNRGLGLAIARELVACGAQTLVTCRRSSAELEAAGVAQIIPGVDIQKDASMATLVESLSSPIDVLINSAGYFKSERESVLNDTMDFADEVMTIDICAVGQLRVTTALYKAGLLVPNAKVAMLTSQGGSIAWRDVQCPDGGDYGHHMSKAAANMGGKLLANEMKGSLLVSMLHPGFNRTEMTAKYKHIWDIEGAVDASVGAKRVCHEINEMTAESSGKFINCEDGLEIPW